MTEYICNDCKQTFKIKSYKTKNKFTNTYLCYSCSCKYNKLYWTKDKKEEARKKRIIFNKTIMKDIILNKSEKEKKEIADKKRKTFYKRSENDRKKINKKRTIGFQKYNLARSKIKKKKYFLIEKEKGLI